MLYLFYFLCSLLFFSCAQVIFVQNPVFAVFYLILGFCNACGILILFGIDFLGLLLLIIYVGAIAVLFLFVIIMLNIQTGIYTSIKQKFGNFFVIFSFLIIGFFLIFLFQFVWKDFSNPFLETRILFEISPSFFAVCWFYFFDTSLTILMIGSVLYCYFAVPFLLAGVILLISIVGSVVLAIENLNSNKNKILQQKEFRKQEVFFQMSRQASKAIFFIVKKGKV